MNKFSADIPQAIRREFTDRHHLWEKEFPEITRDIIAL
jgi:hypothetical protein